MKKKLLLMFDIILGGISLLIPYGFAFWLLINALAALLLVYNALLKKTGWYKNLFVDYNHEKFPDNVWYRQHDERNFDVVNLGSSGGKWAFNYEDLPVKAMNWAVQPQTLTDDFRILKNFHSILRHKGYVLITIMPFTSLNKAVGMIDTFKYVGSLDYTLLDPKYKKKASFYRRFPFLFGKKALKGFVRFVLKKEISVNVQPKSQPMSSLQLDADAKRWIDGWKRQFGISDFEDSFTEKNKKERSHRVSLMRDIIDFCVEREYVPVYVIPPVTRHLSSYYTSKFQETYIYSFLKEINRNVRLLDYSNEKELKPDKFYFNSFFMNEVGAKCFTHRVLNDLKLI